MKPSHLLLWLVMMLPCSSLTITAFRHALHQNQCGPGQAYWGCVPEPGHTADSDAKFADDCGSHVLPPDNIFDEGSVRCRESTICSKGRHVMFKGNAAECLRISAGNEENVTMYESADCTGPGRSLIVWPDTTVDVNDRTKDYHCVTIADSLPSMALDVARRGRAAHSSQ